MKRQILTNCRAVLPGRVVDGSVIVEGGQIADIVESRYPDGLDLGGAMLIPGIIDIHTDYLEREINPRPSAEFPLEMALYAMDLRALSCGLTTVLSAARISPDRGGSLGSWHGDGIELARRYQVLMPQLRATHLIHVRWDTNFEAVDEPLRELMELSSIGNVVYNDNVPGERQFRDMNALVRSEALRSNLSSEQAREVIQKRIEETRAINNRGKVKAALAGRFPIGSHDDTTVEHVDEAHHMGASLSEMPVTLEAARRAKQLGMMVCMGAPNYFRGGSHCGNLSCVEALAEHLVDILCSDYHFPSLLGSAVRMVQAGTAWHDAMRLITLNPARHLGMDDVAGSIEPGKRADLVAFHPETHHAPVTHVWVNGGLKLAVN